MGLLQNILKELNQYQDKVLITPLSQEEVNEIQSKFNKKLPQYFIDYLLSFGLKQNIFYGFLDSVNEFQDLSEFIESEDYFRFGCNSGEDYWLLKFDEKDRAVYEFEYYDYQEIVSLEKTFDDLLIEGWNDFKVKVKSKPIISTKRWYVQFCIDIVDCKSLCLALQSHIGIKILKGEEYVSTSPAMVRKYQGELELFGKKVTFNKRSHSNWESPMLSFDWNESVQQMHTNSEINIIRNALTKSKLQFKMVDYSIL